MILSSLYPRFRDLGIIWSVFSTALFYATPILYTVQTATSRSHTLGKLIALNRSPDPRARTPVDHLPERQGRAVSRHGDGRRFAEARDRDRDRGRAVRARGVDLQARAPRIAEEL